MQKLVICLLMILGSSQLQAADNSFLYKEVNAIGGYSEEEHWISEKGNHLKNSVGLEWFKKFSNDYGDFMTADIQARLSYNSGLPSDDAWAIEIHNAWAEYKLGFGKHLRIGHFSPAFGLEPGLDTHGTLLQTMAMHDIGFKKDWGLSYRGNLSSFDYQIAAQLGSGMGIKHKDGSYLTTSRIGNPAGRNFNYGVSLLYGDVLESMEARTIPQPHFSEHAITKKRVGVDMQYLIGPFQMMTEVTAGRNDTNDVMGALMEIDYTVPSLQTVTVKAQGQFWTDDPDESRHNISQAALVASWQITQSWTARLGVFHDLESRTESKDTQTFIQLYYFGKSGIIDALL